MTKETPKSSIAPVASINPPKVGEIVKGTVIVQERSSLFVDLGAIGTGIVYGKEFYEIKDRLKDINEGDSISAKISSLENEDGYIELSVSGATRKLVWDELKDSLENRTPVTIKIMGANKGGLIAKVAGLPAFLPVSQLASAHYPKVMGGDPDKILKELQKFVGTDLSVRILNLKPKTGEIILSEKMAEIEMREERLKKYQIGQEIEGDVTGVMEFGIFVRFGAENIEGLIPVAQIPEKLAQNLSENFKIGGKTKAKIIEISNGKVFLSLKEENGEK
ncbi:MAG: S1 RNA-binding domain-containing protein [Candidatus Nealsonbacteria bacterium DGGOD1a]|jgi:Ribosomal protein S1|nr:MAG: S1 RNA-binding domain-containing protein [Candidatus Nealsonbacteria bacterium DGGOD1a]